MKRLAILMLGFAALVLGCSLNARVPPEDQVYLLTGVDAEAATHGGRSACWLGSVDGILGADPLYGTRLTWDNGINTAPVMWPPDFIGRRAGAEVEVVAPFGVVVATTGHRYRMVEGWGKSLPSVSAFRVCDTVNSVTPLP